MISWGSMMWMVSRAFIRDISDVSGVVVSVILDVLNTTIRQQNTVAPLHIAVTITSLASVKVAAAVVVVDPVLVGVGVRGLLVHGRGHVMNRGGHVVNSGEHGGKVIRKS